jgi:hypothetical protein
MTPDETVQRLAQILEGLPAFTEDDVYSAMEAAGIPATDADHAYKFTQIACGRLLLEGLVGRFSNDYSWLNSSGEVVESGQLKDEPYFAAATALVSRQPGHWIGQLGAMSADFAAVNEALTKGSEPGDLETGPVVLFRKNPTASGLEEKANQLIEMLLKVPAPAPRKPWWQFW